MGFQIIYKTPEVSNWFPFARNRVLYQIYKWISFVGNVKKSHSLNKAEIDGGNEALFGYLFTFLRRIKNKV